MNASYASTKALTDARRDHLIRYLGGKCSNCGTTERLEIHHIRGRTWTARKVCRRRRHLLYIAEAIRKEVDLLCRHCNAIAGRPGEVVSTYSDIPD